MKTSALIPKSAGAGILALPLDDNLRSLVQSSVAPSTFRLYSKAWLRFTVWLQSDGPGGLDDLDDQAFARWLSALFAEGLAPSSIRAYAAGVKFILKLDGPPSPAGLLSQRALAGISREGRGRGRGQAAGVKWAEAQRMVQKIGAAPNVHAPSASLRGRAAISLASDCLLRVSELRAVNVGDIQFESDGGGGLLLVRSSKTDQAGAGAELYFGPGTFRALSEWLRRLGDAVGDRSLKAGHHFGLPPSQPVFVRIYRGDAVKADRVSSRRLQEVLKAAMASYLPDDGQRRSSHSFRIGTAQSLAAKGASLVDLQAAGQWTDPSMPAHYARGEIARNGAVARLLHGRRAS